MKFGIRNPEFGICHSFSDHGNYLVFVSEYLFSYSSTSINQLMIYQGKYRILLFNVFSQNYAFSHEPLSSPLHCRSSMFFRSHLLLWSLLAQANER